MAREDLHFRLRLPENLKTRIEQAASESRRSMTAEMVARLEQSFVFPFQVGSEFQQAMEKAPATKIAAFKEDLEDLLSTHFPESVMDISPDEHWKMSLEIYGDLPDAYWPLFREQVLKVCRMLAGDPNWLPPEERK